MVIINIGDTVALSGWGEGTVVDAVRDPEYRAFDAILVEFEDGDQWCTASDLTVIC